MPPAGGNKLPMSGGGSPATEGAIPKGEPCRELPLTAGTSDNSPHVMSTRRARSIASGRRAADYSDITFIIGWVGMTRLNDGTRFPVPRSPAATVTAKRVRWLLPRQ
jgi:hypothetical protein